MKFLFDLFPVALFFATLKWSEKNAEIAQSLISKYFSGVIANGVTSLELAPIMLATIVTVAASVLQIGYLLVRRKKVDTMLWVSFIIVMVFGGATIYFQSPTFIKIKLTILYWCNASVFLLAQLIFKKNLVKAAMGEQITLPETVWSRLNYAWATFFLLMGALNLYIAFNFSTDIWANFKFISFIVILPAFIIAQSLFLAKYMEEPAQ